MRTRFATVLLLLIALVAAGCGDDEADEAAAGGEGCEIDQLNLVEDGVLTIATGEPVFPPWMMDDDPTNQEGRAFVGRFLQCQLEQLFFA